MRDLVTADEARNIREYLMGHSGASCGPDPSDEPPTLPGQDAIRLVDTILALLPSDDSPPDADPKLQALANAALHEQIRTVEAERDEARLVLLALADGLDRAQVAADFGKAWPECATHVLNALPDANHDGRWDTYAAALRKLAGA